MLCADGFDAISARDLSHDRWAEADILAYAISVGRAVVTHNLDDYARLAHDYAANGQEHFGIIVSEQLLIGEMRRRLLRLLDRFSRDEMINAVWFPSAFADRP